MGSWPPAMGQNCCVAAISFLQGIGQSGQAVKGPVIVNGLAQVDHHWGEPGGIDGQRSEGLKPKDFSNQGCLSKQLGRFRTQCGSSGLGTPSSISSSTFGVGSGSVPGSLTSRSLTGKASGTQLLRASKSIGKPFRHFDGSTTESVNPGPDASRASDSEQPELPAARPPASPKKFKHGVRLA